MFYWTNFRSKCVEPGIIFCLKKKKKKTFAVLTTNQCLFINTELLYFKGFVVVFIEYYYLQRDDASSNF